MRKSVNVKGREMLYEKGVKWKRMSCEKGCELKQLWNKQVLILERWERMWNGYKMQKSDKGGEMKMGQILKLFKFFVC